MKTRIAMAVLAMVLPGSCQSAQEAKPKENVEQVIRYLLDYVAGSDCTFVRNGTAYDGKKASGHMESKYDYYRKEIKTPEDFIRLAASKSELSGRPYMIKTKDGKELRCDEWMTGLLTEYRKKQKDKEKPKE